MAIGEYLQKMRDGGSPDADPKKKDGKGDRPEMSRAVKLTDDEMKAFAGVSPGTDVTCEVQATLEDGSLRVMSVSPPQGGGGEDDMAQQVAQKVNPGVPGMPV